MTKEYNKAEHDNRVYVCDGIALPGRKVDIEQEPTAEQLPRWGAGVESPHASAVGCRTPCNLSDCSALLVKISVDKCLLPCYNGSRRKGKCSTSHLEN